MKMCSKVDQTATLSPQDNYFPEVLENCKEICYNVENAKAKWRKPDEEVRIMAPKRSGRSRGVTKQNRADEHRG